MRTRAVVLREVSTARPYGATRPVAVEELELGAPREGEVLVRTAAAGLCHSDLSVVNGDRVRPLPMALLGSYMGDAVPSRDIPRFLGLWRAGLLPVEELHTGTVQLATEHVNRSLEALADGTAIRQVLDTSGLLAA
ncbi:hypothetical protein AN217_17990 [Streptomyces qinglanensis]|uniref:Alcohol dehydrogenase-like N-terminal domain-containing protein n=1 Tax=Streptomyces qinglanensis TaxID=943816 RepID=A0A1E7K635_9ACTN|nr:alcohol dehydrogenase catalytic domain-containing protein [Streptomyces qinglanensis]OEU99392.1 hypothetical protein AN217_17990 [Streptomyces qinglanensis]OEV26102.1 hypothetical protein AN220_10005 [Streptomyces nanshensis]OEV26105.1 hypothetical protein AN220_10020 [Streptomyces nanshensis]